MLAQLDTRQEQAQLAAVEAQRELARLNFERMQGLLNERVISRAEFDRATAEQRQTEARVGEIRAAIERKTIRAPFSGILGIRQVNLGQYLAGGDPLVTLQSLNPIYVNFGVPQQDAGQVRGRPRRAHHDGRRSPASSSTGRVTAIDSIVDEATRNIQVQATLANPGRHAAARHVRADRGRARRQPARSSRCRPRRSATRRTATRSSSSTELKDPNGQTYRGVRQQFVKLGGARGDQVAVVSGVKPGDEVVTSGVFKLRNGAAVADQQQGAAGEQPGAEAGGQLMKFTDLFVKRPVLAIVVNLVILIAGLQSIRALSVRQYPRSDIAVVRVDDGLRRRERRSRARLHHDAARARHRQRRRHRLHGVVERAGRSARSPCT